MARVLQGFLGPFTGKVGGAVGGIWKGINYIKGYVVPANPNTPAQQSQRSKFSVVVSLAQNILGTVISTFWNPFAVKMSGYNYFIQQFINSCSSTGLCLATSVLAKGTLETAPGGITASYDSVTGAVTCEFSPVTSGNGFGSDAVNWIILRNTDNNVLAYEFGFDDRSDGQIVDSINTGLLASDITIFLWFSRGTGSEFMISDSMGAVCTAS